MEVSKVVLSIIGGLFQGLAAAVILKSQLKNNIKKQFFIIWILIALYSVFSIIFIDNQLRFIFALLFFSLVTYFICGIKDSTIIVYAFNTEFILVISEIIISLLLVIIGFNSKSIVSDPIYNLLANIAISLFSIILVKLPFVKKLISRIHKVFNKNKRLLNHMCILIIIVYLIVLKNGLEFLLKSNYYINVLFITGIVTILTIIIKNELKYNQLNEENKMMLSYVTKYEKIITEKGKANHEFKNQLMVIRGYAQMNSPKLIEYIDSLTQDANKTHSSYLISQLNNFPDGGVKGLLYYKLSVMEDYKINYQMNVVKGVKSSLNNLNTEFYKNITKILGVLLDNAIDASSKSKAKKVIIDVCKEKGYVNFVIYNSYKGKIDLSKIGTGFSTKGSGHGYGLKLVKDIIDNNNEFILENYLEDTFYVTKLSIKITKKKNKKK